MNPIPPFPVSLALATALAGGCASREPAPSVVLRPDDRLVPAALTVGDGPAPPPAEVRVPVPSPQLRPFPPAAPPPVTTGLAAVAAAKAAATTRPTSDAFVEAVQRYDYAPGVVYQLVTSPAFVTSVVLRSGERVLAASAGDTTRWSIEAVEAGAGPARRTLLLVKPLRPFVTTNLVVATDERVYQLELTSVEAPVYHTAVEWNYPFADPVLLRARADDDRRSAAATADRGLDLSRVNFDYLVLTQPKQPPPAWAPLRAFDDGRRTYVQFPPGLPAGEAPPLFVLGRGGDAELVNYRVSGGYYVVDRLIDRAELRAGRAPQQVVRIVRAEAGRAPGGKR